MLAPRGTSPRENFHRSWDGSIASDGHSNLSKQFDVLGTVEIRIISKGIPYTPTFECPGSLEFEPSLGKPPIELASFFRATPATFNLAGVSELLDRCEQIIE